MSANTSIKEGGQARSFGPVVALMVQGNDGKYYPWVLESDRQLDNLSVDKNGIYRASDRGVYGWDRVSVNVETTDSVTGRDPDTGEEKSVTVDPETGELVETVVPVEIRITILPTKLEYANGESVDITGIVVKAYKATGGEFGTVPNNELSINPTVATVGSDTGGSGSATSDLQGNLAQPIIFLPAGSAIHCITSEWGDNVKARFDCDTIWCINSEHYIVYGAADNFNKLSDYDIKQWRTNRGEVEPAEWRRTQFMRGSNRYTNSNKTVYYGSYGGWFDVVSWVVQPPTISTSDYPNGADAWTVVYGERSVDPGGNQTIIVSWPRPGDGASLETSFNITVTGGE